jgi:hypothetical protein
VTSNSNVVVMNLMPVSEKLTRTNHTLWRAQVLAVLHGSQLARFLDGANKPPAEIQVKKQLEKAEETDEVTNPVFEVWKAQELHVLSYLLTSVSHDVLVQVTVLQSVTDV